MENLLSIIIVNYKTPDLLKGCVQSLVDTIRSTAYEIIVVDSESDGKAKVMLSTMFPDISCISFSENIGYAKAVNAGIHDAKGTHFLILNPDTVAIENSIDSMIYFMETEGAKKRIGMVGPKLVGFGGETQYSAFRFYTPLTIVLRRTFLGKLPLLKKKIDSFLLKDKDIESITAPQNVDWLMGSALLVTRTAVDVVGGMDERFFMYFEDVDWARRFWKNGYNVVYFPAASLRHFHQKSSDKFGVLDVVLNKMTRMHIKSAFLYFLKYRFKTVHYV